MKHLYEATAILILMLFSGLNCHNRTAPKPLQYSKEAPTWQEMQELIEAGNDSLNACFQLLNKQKPKKAKRIEIVNPGNDTNFFITNDSLIYE